jgi:dienelactone hydrolase
MYVHAVTIPCVALVATGLVGIIVPLPATAADAAQHARCVRMLRVTGVMGDDVLFLRSSPQVPDPSQADNRLIGIPPEAKRIEELGSSQGGWQHIRYMGQEGYASTRYLVPDAIDCPDGLLTKTDQPGSATDQSAPSALADPLNLKATTEEGYRIEEGFFRVTIKGRAYLLQGLVVKKADAAGKLPIMMLAHGTASSAKERLEMTPRGARDNIVRMLRAYARRGWLAVFVLRRGYGQSDGPIPVSNFKCDGISGPTFEEFSNADADDLEAFLTQIGQREDADMGRIITLGISGGGAAVVALSARNIRGHQLVINVSGGVRITCGSGNDNRARLVEAMRHFGAKSRVPNLWYYAKTDHLFPEETVVAMRTAFLEGGGYARLTHYDKVIDYTINKDVDGHMLWGKASYNVMVDIDAYLRTRGLPTWNYNEAQTLAKKIGIERSSGLVAKLEQYLAAPDHKALVQSTIDRVRIEYGYGYPALGQAKQATLDICQKRHPGHTCKVVDPPESTPTPPAPTPTSNSNKPDGQDTTTSMEVKPNEQVLTEAGR